MTEIEKAGKNPNDNNFCSLPNKVLQGKEKCTVEIHQTLLNASTISER
jgi:hypothetical protein